MTDSGKETQFGVSVVPFAEAREFRFDAFVFWPGEDPEGQTRRFGEYIAPAVREAVMLQREDKHGP